MLSCLAGQRRLERAPQQVQLVRRRGHVGGGGRRNVGQFDDSGQGTHEYAHPLADGKAIGHAPARAASPAARRLTHVNESQALAARVCDPKSSA